MNKTKVLDIGRMYKSVHVQKIINSKKQSKLLNLMAKRQLPPRCNRGRNPFYEMQLDKIQDQKTRISLIKEKNPKQIRYSQKKQKKVVKQNIKNGVQARRDMYNENKRKFKFTRGIHYFYDLTKLQRTPQSVSYVTFPSKKQQKVSKNNSYTINYSRDNQFIGNTKISKLINRKYIGLPQHKQCQAEFQHPFIYHQKTAYEVMQMKRNDKNQCHHYLFETEDKKHNLDRMIKQLEFIYKKITFFLNPANINKLKAFSIIQKDGQFSQVFFESNEYTDEQKKQILKDRIQLLKQKRQKLNVTYQNTSQFYYKNSLDQKIYNQVKHLKHNLNRFAIYHQMDKRIKQHQKELSKQENSQIMGNFHLSHMDLDYFSVCSQINDYFCIDVKNFDPFIVEKSMKLISIRLFHQGENCFYFAKKIFSRLLNKELTLEKEIKPLTFEIYLTKIKQMEQQLQKYWRKNQTNLQIPIKSQSQPKTVSKASRCAKSNFKQKHEPCPRQIKIKINERIIKIQFYQYYCLKIFITVYESLLIIRDFMHRTENKRFNLIQNLASLYYPKVQNRFLAIVQVPQFGLLSVALDKLVDVITHKNKSFEPINYELFVQLLDKEKKIITFVKEIQSHSPSEQSSLFKRSASVSELLNENRTIQIQEENDIPNQPRKLVK